MEQLQDGHCIQKHFSHYYCKYFHRTYIACIFLKEIDVGWGVEGWGGGGNAERSEASVARAKPGNSS